MKIKQIFTMFLCIVLITCSINYSALAEENDGQGTEHIHNYTYVDKENGTHDKMCECMEESENEVHEYSDGTCVCGAEEELESYNETEHEHNYMYIDKEDGTHDKMCDCMEEPENEEHVYENGSCYCGVKELENDNIDSNNVEHIFSYESNGDGTHEVVCSISGCEIHSRNSSSCEIKEGTCSKCGYIEENVISLCADGVETTMSGPSDDDIVHFSWDNFTWYVDKEWNFYLYGTVDDSVGFYDVSAQSDIGLSRLEQYKDKIKTATINLEGKIRGHELFYGWKNLKSVDFSNSTVGIYSGARMFAGCSSLETINWGKAKVLMTHKVDSMFSGCSLLTNIDLSSFTSFSNTVTANHMFYGCSSLANIDLGKISAENSVTSIIDMRNMLDSCTSLKSVKFGSVETNYINDIFKGCTSLENIDLGSVNYKGSDSIEDVIVSCNNIKFFVSPKTNNKTIIIPKEMYTLDNYKYDKDSTVNLGTTSLTLHVHEYNDESVKRDNEYHWKECLYCSNVFEKDSHDWSEWNVLSPATHLSTGVKTRVCSVCDTEETDTIEIISHSYSIEWNKDDLSHWHECECGDKKDIASHNWGAWVTEKEPTHYEAGQKKRNCRVCGKEEIETIKSRDHNYGNEWNWYSDANNHWYECECGDKKDIASHTWREWVVEKEPTHYETGIRKHVCSVCGRAEREVIDAVPHVYNEEWQMTFEKHWHECECGDKKDESSHSWTAWETVIPATHMKEGVKKHVCSICHYEETDTTPKDDTHRYLVDWQSSILGHWKVCECGETSEVESHSYGSWEVVLDSTHISEGVKKHSCSICDYQETDIVEKKEGHEFGDNWQKNADEHWKVCACGAITSTDTHNMSTTWEVIVEPTYSSVGKEKKSCECGYTIYQDIPRRSQEEIAIEVVPSEAGAPDSSVINLPNIVKDNIYGDLLISEKAEFDSGNPVKVYTKVNSATVSEIIKNKAEAAAGPESNVCIYLDISLYVKVGSQPERSIEPGGPVTVKFELPEEYKNTDSSKKRTYKIVHMLSNGDVELLTCYYNSNDNTITFTTTSFSEFALAYMDTDIKNDISYHIESDSKVSREVNTGKSEEKTIVITPSLPYMTISGLSTGSLGDMAADLKALNTTERDRVNHIIFSNYYASKKNLKATVLDTKDIYAPSSVSKEWKTTNRILTWKNSGAKLGDLIYVTWYCQEAHDMRFIPAIVSGDGTVYFAVPCTGNVSTVSIVKLTF